MDPTIRPDSAETKPDERPAFDRERVARVLTWLGILLLGIALVFAGKFLAQHYLR